MDKLSASISARRGGQDWSRSESNIGMKELYPISSSSTFFSLDCVNGELKLIQNRLKNRFWGKRTTIHHR